MKNISILFIIIIIIILIILFSKENFDFANNNLIDSINENKLKLSNIDISGNINISNNINVDGIIKLNDKNIIDIMYPIDSIWFSKKKYNLNDKTQLLGTPLYYGKWNCLNTSSDNNVFGLIKNGNSSNYIGDNKLKPEQLPSHSHKGIYSDNSREPTGSSDGFYNRLIRATNGGGSEGNYNEYLYIKNSIGLFDDDKKIYKDLSKETEKTKDTEAIDKTIIPKGYYVYGYIKTEL